VLVRVHAVNMLSDILGIGAGTDMAGDSVIAQSMRAIEREGRGVLVLIRDLRPQSVSTWIGRRSQSAPRKVEGQERRLVEIGVGSQILRDLGVRDMVLLTNSPESVYVGLEGYGLKIVEQRRIG
jgi:3,4-dihydroxy 2-butanone 4-phosphate synthase/GTP cyclohydrolase II